MNNEIRQRMVDETHRALHRAEDDRFDPSAFLERRGMSPAIQGATLEGLVAWVDCHDTGQTQQEMEQRRRMATCSFFTGMAAGITFKEVTNLSGLIIATFTEEVPDPTPTPPSVVDLFRDILFGRPR